MRKAAGFLMIGDPHMTSQRPKRRTDANFGETVLAKIEVAIAIANERELIPVFLGDMFDRAVEEDEGLKTKLLRALNGLWTPALANLGNHDVAHADIGDGDSIAYLAESRALTLIRNNGPVEVFEIGQHRIGLGGTPFGQEIPRDVTGLFEEAVDGIVWITHHDVAFENAYPGAMMPHEIRGCRLVINGHMHLYKGMIQAGSTTWFCPGNITRMAIDAVDHVPRVWELSATGDLIPHDLPYEPSPFNFTGLLVDSISPGEVPPEGHDEDASAADMRSTFVDLLAAERPEDLERTHDGSLARETIEQKFQRDSTEAPVRTVVLELLKEAAELAEAAKA